MSLATVVQTAIALVAVALIGWIDHATGPRWGFSLFYIAPIVAVGWRLGAVPALLVAGLAALAWLIADVAFYHDVVPSLWNGLTRLVIYGALGAMTASLHDDRRRLRALLEQESRVARTDALTGLVNARAFYERAAEELARCRRRAAPLALVYIDLDNFKQVNDRYGHARGDDLLGVVATVLRASVRASDVAARLGGDEFAILLSDVDRDGAEATAARIVNALADLAPRYPGTEVGGSVGVAWFAAAPADVEAMVHAGDQAMYRAKLGGKHRAVVEAHAGASVSRNAIAARITDGA